MREVLAWFAGFSDKALDICVYIAIAALFALSFVKCVLPVWRTRALLRRGIRALRKGEKSKRSWQDDAFLGKGALYPHWSEYLDNLFFADGEYHNASNVEDYINEETVIQQPGRSALAGAAPGLMVSLGFLGTLLGITQGLAGFSMDSSEEVMNAIRTLIPGMRYAFTTSVAGVVASILFTVITGVVNGSARNTLSDFYAAMHNNAGVLTVDPLNQIAIYQQEQTAQVTAIASEVTGRMAARMGEQLEASIAPLRETLDSFCRYTTRQQLSALDTVVNRFVDRMDESLQGQFRSLGSCIEETVRWQKQTQSGMNALLAGMDKAAQDVQEIGRTVEGLLAQAEVYLGRIGAMQEKTEEAYDRMSANVEQMEIVGRQQSAALQTITKLQGELGRERSETREAIAAQDRAAMETLSGLRDDLNATAAAMRESGRTLADSHRAFVEGVNEDLEKTYNTLLADIAETGKKLEWLVEDVKETMGRLPAVLDDAAGLYADQGARLADALRQAQDALYSAAERIDRR